MTYIPNKDNSEASNKFDLFWETEELPSLKTILKDKQMREVIRLASKTSYLQGYIDGSTKTSEILSGKQL